MPRLVKTLTDNYNPLVQLRVTAQRQQHWEEMAVTTGAVVVGSTNPIKVRAVQRVFKLAWPDLEWQVEGVESFSAVPAQPRSLEETYLGACNRAMAALARRRADYAVGLESGLFTAHGQRFEQGWIVVLDCNGQRGEGTTPAFAVPDKMLALVDQGMEMGEAADRLFNDVNCKQGIGPVGLLTNGLLNREDTLVDGLKAALVRFLHPELYTGA